MKNRMSHPAVHIVGLMALTAMLACLSSQTAEAQLIAYEGFDYEVGNLNMVGGHDNGGGFGWATEVDPIDNRGPDRLQAAIDGGNPLSGVDYGWDDIGWISNTADPANAGNSVVEVPAGWGYTDSLGQSLQTSGKIAALTNWDNTNRNFDLTGLDPALVTTSNANGNFPDTLAVGVSGTEIWFSVLMQGTNAGMVGEDRFERSFTIELMDGFGQGEKTKFGLGRPWDLQLDGSQDENVANDAYGATAPGNNPRTLASANVLWSEKVFMVARLRYLNVGDPIPGDPTNEFGDELADIWVNPDLGSTPSDADRAIADLVVWDHVLHGIRIGGNADTNYDEIRVGFSYADVAPIATPSGPAGDFDDDGDVDGADFLVWQRDLSDTTNLADWEANFGTVSAIAAAAAVPEPSSLGMVSILLVLAARYRPGRSPREPETEI